MRRLLAVLLFSLPGAALAAADDDAGLVADLMAFYASHEVVSVMTTHCYETTGLDPVYRTAAENWYLRNIGFLQLGDRVLDRLGWADEDQRDEALIHAGTEAMSAYNGAADKAAHCRDLLGRVEDGTLDIDRDLADTLARAQAVANR